MNLETIIEERLWRAIESNYSSRNYTNAILDAIHFLSELIRNKAGLESDGTSLIGEAFGGNSPRLKVNKLQNESEKNIQKGVEQILRGIYQAIRNPRSHEKYNDNQEDADAILIFMNYIINIIDKSKSPFEMNEFVKRVFDPDFAKEDGYAELMVEEIPRKKLFDVFIEVYRNKENGDGDGLGYFLRALYKKLNPEEQEQVCTIISDELKTTNSDKSIIKILHIFPNEFWLKYAEVSRRRIEYKLIESIRNGRYDIVKGKCNNGGFGTWATGICSHFLSKSKLYNILIEKLGSDNRYEQDYVIELFFSEFIALVDVPTPGLIKIINKGLANGDKRFYDAVGILMWLKDNDEHWQKPFIEAYKNFKEIDPNPDLSAEDDDLPF